MARSTFPIVRPTYGTYEWLQKELGTAVGIGANFNHWDHSEVERVDSIIQRGVHRFYQPAGTGQRFQRGYQWSFLKPLATLTTSAPYDTGTIAIVNGVMTITGGVFPAWVLDGEFQFSGTSGAVATIISYSGISVSAVSETYDEVTLVDTTLNAVVGTSFTLNRPKYSMPATFDGMDGPMTYESGAGRSSVLVFPEYEVRRRGQTYHSSGSPQIAALYPATPDASTGTARKIKFYPAPNAVYVLEYRYKIAPTDLLAGEFPLGGRVNAETILMSCLAILSPKLEETFLARLASAIDQDQTSHQAANIGQNLDRSDDIGSDYLDRNSQNNYLTTYDNS
tara:strand:- start:3254 stop:4264 length:1011 start_codon:yes stop_codon:yes gene_type:complete